jgi:uncharacterized protein (UPF0179 family)
MRSEGIMAETKTKVTLVGTVLAKQGVEFIYEGEIAACDSCKVKKACNNLQKGRKYRIVSVRTTHHECAVHLNGATAVEVTDAPITILITPEMAIVNSKNTPELSATRATAGVTRSAGRKGWLTGRNISFPMSSAMPRIFARRGGRSS